MLYDKPFKEYDEQIEHLKNIHLLHIYNALSSETHGQLDVLKSVLSNSKSFTPDELNKLNRQIELLELQAEELSKMKHGSIVLLGQITTISKIMIYDPKRNEDVLSKVKLSNITLDKID